MVVAGGDQTLKSLNNRTAVPPPSIREELLKHALAYRSPLFNL
jgi:hypothetical protein